MFPKASERGPKETRERQSRWRWEEVCMNECRHACIWVCLSACVIVCVRLWNSARNVIWRWSVLVPVPVFLCVRACMLLIIIDKMNVVFSSLELHVANGNQLYFVLELLWRLNANWGFHKMFDAHCGACTNVTCRMSPLRDVSVCLCTWSGLSFTHIVHCCALTS